MISEVNRSGGVEHWFSQRDRDQRVWKGRVTNCRELFREIGIEVEREDVITELYMNVMMKAFEALTLGRSSINKNRV